MKAFYFILSLLILSCSYVIKYNMPKNLWEAFSLEGKVKSSKHKIFEAYKKDGQITLSKKAYFKNETIFSEDGKWAESKTYLDQNMDKPSLIDTFQFNKQKKTYNMVTYDSDKNFKRQKMAEKVSDNIIKFKTIDADNQIISSEEHIYGKYGLKEATKYIYKHNKKIPNMTLMNKYNQKGKIITQTVKFLDTDITYTYKYNQEGRTRARISENEYTKYEYPEVDEKGNWTKRIIYRGKNEKKLRLFNVELREFEYFE